MAGVFWGGGVLVAFGSSRCLGRGGVLVEGVCWWRGVLVLVEGAFWWSEPFNGWRGRFGGRSILV